MNLINNASPEEVHKGLACRKKISLENRTVQAEFAMTVSKSIFLMMVTEF